MEIFYTLQGEGAWAGHAAHFVRLAGCDVGCVWCDVKESWDATGYPKHTAIEIIDKLESSSCKIVVMISSISKFLVGFLLLFAISTASLAQDSVSIDDLKFTEIKEAPADTTLKQTASQISKNEIKKSGGPKLNIDNTEFLATAATEYFFKMLKQEETGIKKNPLRALDSLIDVLFPQKGDNTNCFFLIFTPTPDRRPIRHFN